MNIEENNKLELLKSWHRLKDALSNAIIELEKFNSVEAANEAKEILEREKLTLINLLFENLDFSILGQKRE